MRTTMRPTTGPVAKMGLAMLMQPHAIEILFAEVWNKAFGTWKLNVLWRAAMRPTTRSDLPRQACSLASGGDSNTRQPRCCVGGHAGVTTGLVKWVRQAALWAWGKALLMLLLLGMLFPQHGHEGPVAPMPVEGQGRRCDEATPGCVLVPEHQKKRRCDGGAILPVRSAYASALNASLSC